MKWLLLLVLALGGGYAFYHFAYAHPEVLACRHFGELCGEGSAKQCEESFDALTKVSPSEDIKKATTCVGNATSCPQAAGCIAGGVGKAGLKAAGEFLKGLGESIK